MTQPRPPHDRQFVRDIAKQIDRRRARRRTVRWFLLLVLVALAALYVRFGQGLGLPGVPGLSGLSQSSESSDEPQSLYERSNAPRRCAIRVTPSGITLDGKPATREAAVAACKATSGADVVVTGDTREGDWQALRAALEAAGVRYFLPGPSERRPGH